MSPFDVKPSFYIAKALEATFKAHNMTLEGGGRGVNPYHHNDVNFSSNSLDKPPK